MTEPIFSLATLIKLLDRFYPRLLTQIDRDPDSPTFGSCDRGFWMYRLHDFESGVLQQSGLTFAALAELAEDADFKSCTHLRRKYIRTWRRLAAAINERTLSSYSSAGMLDEYYPGEQSFPATAFASYAVLKAATMLGQREVIEAQALRATYENFLRRSPSPAANQDAAAAAFLALYSKATGRRNHETQAAVERLLTRDEQEGRFLEYGGMDLGYATVSLNYLGYLHADSNFRTHKPLLELARLIADFITPTGQLGGEYASRSTTYFLPFGLLQAAYLDANLAGRLALLNLQSAYLRLDDRYLMHYCLPALAMAALALARRGMPEIVPFQPPREWESRHHANIQLCTSRKHDCVVFVGLNKGAAFQVENRGATTVDAGYRLERAGNVYATCVVTDEPDTQVQCTETAVEMIVKAPFQRYIVLVASSPKTVALRILSLFGPALNRFFKRTLVKRPQFLPGVSLTRILILDYAANCLIIRDKISGMRLGDRLTRAPAASFRLVPSAKFRQVGEEEALDRCGEVLEGDTFEYQIDFGARQIA